MAAYATVDQLRDRIGTDKSRRDPQLLSALEAAAAQINEWCGRTFTVAPAVHGGALRYFRPERSDCIWIDDCVTDGSTVVEYRTAREGTWTAITVDDDWLAEPLNQRFNERTWSTEAITIVNPSIFVPANMRWPSLRVTARWGWPETPEPIIEANLLQAAKLFDRVGSPAGVLGADGFGAVIRVTTGMDRDAEGILMPYRREILR